jgi:hypothetical protein
MMLHGSSSIQWSEGGYLMPGNEIATEVAAQYEQELPHLLSISDESSRDSDCLENFVDVAVHSEYEPCVDPICFSCTLRLP